MPDRTPKPEPPSVPPLVVGLCGGVGSGKSTVARMLEEHGGRVLDADAAARACLDGDDVRAALVNRLGPEILDSEGRVDRAAVAGRVFAPDGDPLRAWLEDLVHPRVRERLGEQLTDARSEPSPPWCVVLDVPLLVEGPILDWCDRVVFVDTSAASRRTRTMAARGWNADEVARREAAQAALEDKREHADHVVTNDGSIEDLEEAVTRLVRELRSHTGSETRIKETESPDDPPHGGS